MLNAIFTVVGASALDDVSLEDLARAAPIVLVVGIALMFWINKEYKKSQSK